MDAHQSDALVKFWGLHWLPYHVCVHSFAITFCAQNRTDFSSTYSNILCTNISKIVSFQSLFLTSRCLLTYLVDIIVAFFFSAIILSFKESMRHFLLFWSQFWHTWDFHIHFSCHTRHWKQSSMSPKFWFTKERRKKGSGSIISMCNMTMIIRHDFLWLKVSMVHRLLRGARRTFQRTVFTVVSVVHQVSLGSNLPKNYDQSSSEFG